MSKYSTQLILLFLLTTSELSVFGQLKASFTSDTGICLTQSFPYLFQCVNIRCIPFLYYSHRLRRFFCCCRSHKNRQQTGGCFYRQPKNNLRFHTYQFPRNQRWGGRRSVVLGIWRWRNLYPAGAYAFLPGYRFLLRKAYCMEQWLFRYA